MRGTAFALCPSHVGCVCGALNGGTESCITEQEFAHCGDSHRTPWVLVLQGGTEGMRI